MFDALHQLTRDHGNMARLLDLLERHIAEYGGGRPLDVEAFGGIMDYLLHFPDLCHHPKEDLVYRRLRNVDAHRAALVGDIVAEHQALAKLTRGFAAAVRNVACGAELPRPWFEKAGSRLIAETREHIDKEERGLFPLALSSLTARDWWEIDGAVLSPSEPPFSAKIERDYIALYDRIMELGA
jgi:hemerythrin-like domain-containing protein